MKNLFLIPALALSVLLQAELVPDLNPLLQIIANAPVLGIFGWIYYMQQKQNNRLIEAIVKMSTKKRGQDEDE